MNQTEQFIEVGKAYIDALNKLDIDNTESVAHILDILDCVHPAPGYQLGVYIEDPPRPFCGLTSWLCCYEGEKYKIITRPSDLDDYVLYRYSSMTYLRYTFDLFNHLSIKQSDMGAWQAYLISISKTLLPFTSRVYYTKRQLIFSHEQLNDIDLLFDEERTPELTNLDTDVSPSIHFDGKQAMVSCCHWNDWGGLIRENAKITFFNGRVYLFEDFNEEKLFNYDCGIRY